jgi:hypothetical protein
VPQPIATDYTKCAENRKVLAEGNQYSSEKALLSILQLADKQLTILDYSFKLSRQVAPNTVPKNVTSTKCIAIQCSKKRQIITGRHIKLNNKEELKIDCAAQSLNHRCFMQKRFDDSI